MNAIDLIRQCQSAGIRLQVRGDRLHVEAPAGSLNQELRQALAEHKATLLALHAIRTRLRIVDELPLEELQATADQVALAADHLDGNGDPLAQTILTFYLCCLADRVSA
jgi:geranylgeranyl pyrophosphate synthase